MNTSTTRILYLLCAVAFVVILARAYINVKGTAALVPPVPQPQASQSQFSRARSATPRSQAHSAPFFAGHLPARPCRYPRPR